MKTKEDDYHYYPRTIDRLNWYYEEPIGIIMVHEVRDKNGNFIQTDTFVIPWRMMRLTMKNFEKKYKRRQNESLPKD